MSEKIVPQNDEEVKPKECCVCHKPFQPEEETQVLCPGCEGLGIRCGCVMPWQSCAICRAVETLTKDEAAPVLDLDWYGYKPEEVLA